MNAPVRPSPDLPRRLFTTQDVFRMVDAGVMQSDENVELIQGELVVVAANKNDHEIFKSAMLEWLVKGKATTSGWAWRPRSIWPRCCSSNPT
jgi:hypothetical protein